MVKDEYVPAREAALSSYRAGFLRAIDKALALQIEARPQSIAAWRGELLAPDPAKPGWLAKTFSGEKPAEPAAAPQNEPPKAAAKKQAATAAPPPPDAPGPKGGMLDFFEGLKKKPAATPPRADVQKAAEAAKPQKAKGKADATEDKPAASPASGALGTPQGTMKLDEPPKPIELPRILRKSKSTDAAETPKSKREAARDRKAEAKEKRKPPSPRALRSGASRWRPVLFKLMIGVGVASAAVALQDNLPSSAPAQTSAIVTGANRPNGTTPAIEIAKPLVELRGHTGPVTGTAFSDDGASLITAGQDGTSRSGTRATVRSYARSFSATEQQRRLLSRARAHSLATVPAKSSYGIGNVATKSRASSATMPKSGRSPSPDAMIASQPRAMIGRSRSGMQTRPQSRFK